MLALSEAIAAESPGLALPDPIWALRLFEADSGALVTGARAGALHAWRITDAGKVAWELDLDCDDPVPKVGTIPSLAIAGPVLACSKGSVVKAFSLDDGKAAWSWSGDTDVRSITASLGDDPRFVVATVKSLTLVSTDKGKGSVSEPIPKDSPALWAVGGRIAVLGAASGSGPWRGIPLFESKAERKKAGAVSWQTKEAFGPPDLADGVLRGVGGPDVVTVDLLDGKVISREPRDLVGPDVPGERGLTVPAPGTIAFLDPRTSVARWSRPARTPVLIHERRGRLIAASDEGFDAWSTDGTPLGSGAWTGVVTDVASSPATVFALLEVLSPRDALKGAGNAHHPEAPAPPTPSRAVLAVVPLGTPGTPPTPPKSAPWPDGTTLTWQVDGPVDGRLVRVLGDPEWKLYQDDALVRAGPDGLVPLVEPVPAPGPATTWVAGWEVPVHVAGTPGSRAWVLDYPDHPTVLFREEGDARAWLVAVDLP